MKYFLWGVFWICVYIALVVTPLFVLLSVTDISGIDFWWDFSLALGFAGTAMMGVMFFLTARFRWVTAPFGIDLIYYFHRQISWVLYAFVVVHPLLIFWVDPQMIGYLNIFDTPYYMLAGIGSTAALTILMATSIWRKQFNIHYDTWRLIHAVLAVVALVLALIHIEGVGYYVKTTWQGILWITITASCLVMHFYVRLIRPWLMLRRPYQVKEVIEERGNTWTLVLQPRGHQGFRFLPGQFAWLTLWSSPFALREHPFSISSSAEHPEEIHFTIKELGDFTRRMGTVVPGETAYLDGPYGAFSIDRNPAPGYVFIAGGIGIAPMMGMLRTLADRGEQCPLILFYAYKNLSYLTFYEELETLREKLNLTLIYILSDPPENWQGETGFLTEAIVGKYLPENRLACEYFICGPVPLLHSAETILHQQKVPLAQVHSEIFDLA